MADTTKMLDAVERRCVQRSLEPLHDMPEAMRRDFVHDLGLPASCPREEIVARLADVVLAAPRVEREAIISTLLLGMNSPPLPAYNLAPRAEPPPRYSQSDGVGVGLVGDQHPVLETSFDANPVQPPITLTFPPSAFGSEFRLDAPAANPHRDYFAPESHTDGGEDGLAVASHHARDKPPKLALCGAPSFQRTPLVLVVWTLLLLSLAPIQYGLTTLLGYDHTRYHTQLFAGLTGGFFFWPLYLLCSLGVCRLLCSRAHRLKGKVHTSSVVAVICVVVCGLALSLPICILFGSGVQGTWYYTLIKKQENVYLRDIPLNSDVLAYRTLDGTFNASTFGHYTLTSFDSDGVPSSSTGYYVRVDPNASLPTTFPIYAVNSNTDDVPDSFSNVFDNGIYQGWLVRLDCTRDDNCPIIVAAIRQDYGGTYLAMRNKDPSQRLAYYFEMMINNVIAAAVFYGLLVLATIVLVRNTRKDLAG